MIAQECFVCSRGSSFVGCRGALCVSVPNAIRPVASSYDGVLHTELVEGPKWYSRPPSFTGGTSGFGSSPTSYFHSALPVFGSSAATKPRPVQHLCVGCVAMKCSIPPPATISCPAARIGAAKKQFDGWAPGKGSCRVSTTHSSLPLLRSSAYTRPPTSAM